MQKNPVAILKAQLDALPALGVEVAGGDQSNLTEWIEATKTALRLAFDEDHSSYGRFTSLTFQAGVAAIFHDETEAQQRAKDTKAAVGDLHVAEALLKAAVTEAEFRHADAHISQGTRRNLNPTIFVGHGGASTDWRSLGDYIRQLGYEVETFESQATAGYSVTERVMEMLDRADMAFLVMSAEDEQATADNDPAPRLRARQNVIHEAGLFQGRLGWKRAILIVDEEVERFSNADGITEIRYKAGEISNKFGDVASVIKRELG